MSRRGPPQSSATPGHGAHSGVKLPSLALATTLAGLMKSQRRNVVQKKTVAAAGGDRLAEMMREHGSKIMLAVVLVLLAVVLYLRWSNSRTQQVSQVNTSLVQAETLLEQFRDHPLQNFGASPHQFSGRRKQLQDEIERLVGDVLSTSSDASQQAEAKLIRGDLYWAIGTVGDLPESTTQPDTLLKQKPSELIDLASQQYNEVLDSSNKTALRDDLIARARFSLAAIAEDKGDWPAARAQYEALVNDSKLSKSFRDQATMRMGLLGKLEQPVFVAHGIRPETKPATDLHLGPTFSPIIPTTTTGPVTTPSSRPTTLSTAPPPTTAPATEPAAVSAPATTQPSSSPSHP